MTTYKGKIGASDLQLYDGKNRTFDRTTSSGGTLTQARIGNRVDVLQVYGDGVTPTEAALLDAIRTIGTTEACLELAPGAWPITANLTTGASLTFRLARGATFAVDAGITLDLSLSCVFPEEVTWYSGAGTVTVGSLVVGPSTSTFSAGAGIALAGSAPVVITSAILTAVTVYTTAGANTWTKAADLSHVVVWVQGGGGGGGKDGSVAGGGGGGGGCAIKLIVAADLGATETATVGAGGAGATSANGTAGGNSTFGAHCTGAGGSGAAGAAGAAGGAGTGGSFGLTGATGDRSYGGGSSFLGNGGSRPNASAAGNAGTGYGGGGGGGDTGQNGGAGSDGIIIVWEYRT